jgi:hypothetical protein
MVDPSALSFATNAPPRGSGLISVLLKSQREGGDFVFRAAWLKEPIANRSNIATISAVDTLIGNIRNAVLLRRGSQAVDSVGITVSPIVKSTARYQQCGYD